MSRDYANHPVMVALGRIEQKVDAQGAAIAEIKEKHTAEIDGPPGRPQDGLKGQVLQLRDAHDRQNWWTKTALGAAITSLIGAVLIAIGLKSGGP